MARLGAALVEADGFLVLCSCSHAADLARFREASLRGVAQAGRGADPARGRGRADHPVHADLAETTYLKALFLRLAPLRVVLDACVLFPTVMREMLVARRPSSVRARLVGAHPRGVGAGDPAAAGGAETVARDRHPADARPQAEVEVDEDLAAMLGVAPEVAPRQLTVRVAVLQA